MKSKKIKKFLIFAIMINIALIIIIGVAGYTYIAKGEDKKIQVVPVETSQKTVQATQKDTDFVNLKDFIPDIQIDLRYGTTDNITGKVLYMDKNAYMRRGTAEKLKKAEADFEKLGYRIKVWDAYRPTTVQFELWKAEPDARYIADPYTGGSVHSYGAALDMTLVDKEGNEIPMPSDFDHFGKNAWKIYKGVSKDRVKNAKMMERIMVQDGFDSVYFEWWHFNDSDWKNYGQVDELHFAAVKTPEYEIEVSSAPDGGNSVFDKVKGYFSTMRDGLAKIDFESVKAEAKYQVSRLENIFNEYSSE